MPDETTRQPLPGEFSHAPDPRLPIATACGQRISSRVLMAVASVATCPDCVAVYEAGPESEPNGFVVENVLSDEPTVIRDPDGNVVG